MMERTIRDSQTDKIDLAGTVVGHGVTGATTWIESETVQATNRELEVASVQGKR